MTKKTLKPGIKKEAILTPKIPQIRANTKISKLIDLISESENGIALKEISEAMKWRLHTTRSILSRLNKIHKTGIVADKSESGNTIYKISKKEE